MDSYEALAAAYDELTEDVEYEKRADFVEKLFLRAKRPVRSLLDLACGTGTMTELFARRGYTVTGVDYSPEMLAQAQQKLATLDPPPLLLCQSMPATRVVGKGRRRYLLPGQHQLSDASARRAAHVCPPA